jgi:C1A family cysteine protease
MRLWVLSLAAAAVAAQSEPLPPPPPFSAWAQARGRVYATPEERALRARVYAANAAAIAAHNARGAPWRMAVNDFSDLTAAEFKSRVASGYKAPPHAPPPAAHVAAGSGGAAPGSVDWTSRGAVTAVKNQGSCGSCWAFSAVGALEGAHFLATKELVSLSEQNVCDCASKAGCSGGSMDAAFAWVQKNKGLCTEAAYPYHAKDEACHDSACAKVGPIRGFAGVKADDEAALVAALAGRPVSVAIEADQASFQHYRDGVLTAACGTKLDHGVLAVGYGVQDRHAFFKVKNSWGASWGDKGYVLLARNGTHNGAHGQCGILMSPSYPEA